MNSGGMKFSVRKGLVALSVLPCIVGFLCIGQLRADESGQPVRFKLSDNGDSGKVIVVEEQAPEKREGAKVFDNGLRFKRDEEGNIYRIGDFKEVAPRTDHKTNKKATAEATPESKSTNALFPELPTLETLFPHLGWSGFDEVFDGFRDDSNSSPKVHSGAPGLKIKPNQSKPNVSVERKTPKIDKATPTAEPALEVAQEKAATDSVTGLPLLADIELIDLQLPELGLPKLELPNLNLFFGTSSEPLVNSNGEVPKTIENKARVEEPLQEAIEDMIPEDSPMEDVIKKEDKPKEETSSGAKPAPAPASNTSVFELPSSDIGITDVLDEFFDSDQQEVTRSRPVETEPQASAEQPMPNQTAEIRLPTIHRVPGRKSLGAKNHKATKTMSPTKSSFDLFSEFRIPEFNNPFDFGSDVDDAPVTPQRTIKIPALKKPTAALPDTAILESLPELDSDRPNVPGLKLMRTKAPTNVPMLDSTKTSPSEAVSEDDTELGSGVPLAPAVENADGKLVDPDKILDDYKEKK